MSGDHHWVDTPTLVPKPSEFFGFLYEIRELDTGRLYVGMKQYHFSAGKSKRRCMDRQSDNWKEWHWKDSDWRTYTGSSKDLNEAIKEKGKDNYEFSIIGQYSCSRSLRYAEANYLHKVDALVAKDDEGEYVYYNKAIQDIKFRPPDVVSPETRAKMSEAAKCRSPEHRAKIGESHKGKPKSPETRAKMSEAKKGARWEAKERGDKFYHSEPCKTCGETEKYTSNGGCVACTKEANKEYRKRSKKC